MKTPTLLFPTSRTVFGALAAAALTLLAALPSAQAQPAPTNAPPARVSYQGFLTDATGNVLAPSTPANYSVDFRIYASPNSPGVLWSERQVVTVDKGNFSVILGEGAAIPGENNLNLAGIVANSSTASERYIGLTVTIGTTPTLIQPRLRLLATPYAFLATSARSITDVNGANRLTWNPTSSQMEVSGDLNVTGTLRGNGSGLTGISTASIGNIDATKITTGTLDPNRIPQLAPTKITGVFAIGQIPVLDAARIPSLDAGKITSGAFASDRIPTTLTGQRAFTGGNIGVGTTTPAEELHIQSADTTSTGLRLGNTSAGGKQWTFESTGATASGGAGLLRLNNATDNQSVMTVSSSQITVANNLNVQGALSVGASALPLVAAASGDSIRMIRGSLNITDSGPTFRSGTGFTIAGGGRGFAQLRFSTPFPNNSRPTVIVSAENRGFTAGRATELDLLIDFNNTGNVPDNTIVHFIVIGPR